MINFLTGMIVAALILIGSFGGYIFMILGTAAKKVLNLEKGEKKGDN